MRTIIWTPQCFLPNIKRVLSQCVLFNNGLNHTDHRLLVIHKWVYRALVEWHWQVRIEVLRRTPVPVPLCTPQNVQGMGLDWTWASSVASVMAWPHKLCVNGIMNVQTTLTCTVFWTNPAMSTSHYNLMMIKCYQTEHKLIKIKTFCTAQTADK